MPIKSYTAQLEEVQAAITALLAGAEEVQLDGQRIRMPSLDSLHKREEFLRARALREQPGAAGGLTIGLGVTGR